MERRVFSLRHFERKSKAPKRQKISSLEPNSAESRHPSTTLARQERTSEQLFSEAVSDCLEHPSG